MTDGYPGDVAVVANHMRLSSDPMSVVEHRNDDEKKENVVDRSGDKDDILLDHSNNSRGRGDSAKTASMSHNFSSSYGYNHHSHSHNPNNSTNNNSNNNNTSNTAANSIQRMFKLEAFRFENIFFSRRSDHRLSEAQVILALQFFPQIQDSLRTQGCVTDGVIRVNYTPILREYLALVSSDYRPNPATTIGVDDHNLHHNDCTTTNNNNNNNNISNNQAQTTRTIALLADQSILSPLEEEKESDGNNESDHHINPLPITPPPPPHHHHRVPMEHNVNKPFARSGSDHESEMGGSTAPDQDDSQTLDMADTATTANTINDGNNNSLEPSIVVEDDASMANSREEYGYSNYNSDDDSIENGYENLYSIRFHSAAVHPPAETASRQEKPWSFHAALLKSSQTNNTNHHTTTAAASSNINNNNNNTAKTVSFKEAHGRSNQYQQQQHHDSSTNSRYAWSLSALDWDETEEEYVTAPPSHNVSNHQATPTSVMDVPELFHEHVSLVDGGNATAATSCDGDNHNNTGVNHEEETTNQVEGRWSDHDDDDRGKNDRIITTTSTSTTSSRSNVSTSGSSTSSSIVNRNGVGGSSEEHNNNVEEEDDEEYLSDDTFDELQRKAAYSMGQDIHTRQPYWDDEEYFPVDANLDDVDDDDLDFDDSDEEDEYEAGQPQYWDDPEEFYGVNPKLLVDEDDYYAEEEEDEEELGMTKGDGIDSPTKEADYALSTGQTVSTGDTSTEDFNDMWTTTAQELDMLESKLNATLETTRTYDPPSDNDENPVGQSITPLVTTTARTNPATQQTSVTDIPKPKSSAAAVLENTGKTTATEPSHSDAIRRKQRSLQRKNFTYERVCLDDDITSEVLAAPPPEYRRKSLKKKASSSRRMKHHESIDSETEPTTLHEVGNKRSTTKALASMQDGSLPEKSPSSSRSMHTSSKSSRNDMTASSTGEHANSSKSSRSSRQEESSQTVILSRKEGQAAESKNLAEQAPFRDSSKETKKTGKSSTKHRTSGERSKRRKTRNKLAEIDFQSETGIEL